MRFPMGEYAGDHHFDLCQKQFLLAGFHTEAPGFAFRADYLALPLQTAKPYFYPAVQCSGLFFVLQCCWFSLLELWAAFSLWSPVALGVPQCPFGGGSSQWLQKGS